MRGTPDGRVIRRGARGIIPACAGNTSLAVATTATRGDHPRVCGEHVDFLSARAHLRGSSPRVRGTRSYQLRRRFEEGIIPACAGNTCHAQFCERKRGDHPRVCGEHCAWLSSRSVKRGSSPRVRGTPAEIVVALKAPGIIPACAGNTTARGYRCAAMRDHPRVCGEHKLRAFDLGIPKGSSPRVRGTPVAAHIRRVGDGIIPACAGNTREAPRHGEGLRDHPRVCGEHS